MDVNKIENINGVLNLVSVSSNFSEDYLPIKFVNIYDGKNNSISEPGAIIQAIGLSEKSYLNVILSQSCFCDIFAIINETSTNKAPVSCHRSFMNIANFAGIEYIMGCGEKYDVNNLFLWSSLIIRHGNNFFSTEIPFGDLLCLGMMNSLTVCVRKDIFNKHGKEFEEMEISVKK